MSTRRVVKTLFDGQHWHQHVAVSIEHGRLTSIEPAGNQEIAMNGIMVPGYIDVQVNGGGGVLFNNQPDLPAIKVIGSAHARFGTTAFLPTLITDDVSVMRQAADAVAQAIAENQTGVIGIHFEGPHLSEVKKGVHSSDFIRPISDDEMAIFCRSDIGVVIVTVAPEMVSVDDIQRLVSAGVTVCLGHSNADYATVQAALAAGATGFTHLFNAMSPFQSREPGMVGAALLDEHSFCGLIADGHHVHYQAAELAIKAKKTGKMMLVTDAMSPVGTEQQSFPFFGTRVTRTGDRLNAPNGALAGSCLDMASAVKNCIAYMNQSVDEALRMASLYPAKFLTLDSDYGHLATGARADFVILNDQFETMETVIAGSTRYQAK
ncbi:N-acetylglucosamine-6-phosphate deacetylase [Thalassotalea maritima]|uniref:N-acetylglucosamine-6-phosphate deacetylase n=1 Tax=Thalassotalea maritima TaxID=3242416 RepID=UPI003527A571